MAFVAFSLVLLLVTGWVSLQLFAHMHQFVYYLNRIYFSEISIQHCHIGSG